MNKRQAPGYIMIVMTFIVLIITLVVAFSGGENPSHQSILTAVAIFSAGTNLTMGYFVTLLWDRLNMLAELYLVLTGENQDELEGTLQRLRNTLHQGIKNLRWNLSSSSNTNSSDQGR